MAIPVTLEDALRQLRLTADEVDQDRRTEIETFIADAADWVERYTGLRLVAGLVTEQISGFATGALRAWPVSTKISPIVTYADATGADVPVEAVRLVAHQRPACVAPRIGTRWPFVPVGTVVSVTFRAGYEPTEKAPAAVRRAMLLLIGAYDVDREGGEIFQKAEASARAICDRGGLRLRRL